MENTYSTNEAFREEIEVLAVLKKTCSIRFKGSNDAVASIQARIEGVYTLDEVAYVRTDAGLHIPLNSIVEIDGRKPESFC